MHLPPNHEVQDLGQDACTSHLRLSTGKKKLLIVIDAVVSL